MPREMVPTADVAPRTLARRATDRNGAEVVERRVGVADFLATIYRHLGIRTAGLAFDDFSGRPIPVPADGTPIRELMPG